MPSLPHLSSPLSDGQISLRPAAERDIPEVLIAYQNDRLLPAALGEDRPPSGAALGRRSELAEPERLAGRSLVLTIVEPGADICLGEARIDAVDWEQRRAELRLWVVPERRGGGLGRRAHHLVAGWLETYCGLEAVCPKEDEDGWRPGGSSFPPG
ncbi:MAG TPA: GNAT family N-acetyltransferase [Solirubrobacteraceae bacterium]|nr:GNAT family N-acetyltransferase [Solirubrobacteraceae bacterium]